MSRRCCTVQGGGGRRASRASWVTRVSSGLTALVLGLLASSSRAGSLHPAVERLLPPNPVAPAMAEPAERGDAARPDVARGIGAPGRGGDLILWITLRDAQDDRELAGWPPEGTGAAVLARFGLSVQVSVPRDRVRELAARREVRYVSFPPRPLPLARSQGLDGMRAPQFWSRFSGGKGARLGIIDVGFTGYQRLLGSDLPARVRARSFYFLPGGLTDIGGEGEDHGTACAEIAHDVAPEAEIYLANAGSPAELQLAVDWMIDQGVEVISHSVGWPIGIGDGTGPLAEIVATARRNGVIWVNAAGNFAQANWSSPYRDTDGDRIAEVDSSGGESIFLPPVAALTQLSFWLLWDSWPSSPDLSFELDLLDAGGGLLASSQNEWGDSPYAFRPLAYRTVVATDGLSIRVRSVRGQPEDHRLRVIRLDDDLAPESRVPAGSLAVPGDSPDAIAVGAFGWRGQVLEPFSSYGPTFAGLAKPEILGPDGVETVTTNGAGEGHPFFGTSAACPHVAGAVALLLSAGVEGGLFDGRFERGEVLELLRREAEPPAPPNPEGSTGWGRVRLPLDSPATSAGPALVVTGYGRAEGPALRLLRAARNPGELRLFDATGRLLGTVGGVRVGDTTWEFRPSSVHRALARGRYWALEPGTGTRAGFYWPGRAAR